MTALLTRTTRDLTTRLNRELKRREGDRLKRRVLQHLGRSADALGSITLSVWTWVRETLEGEGFEGRALARHCRVLLDGIDGVLIGYERLLTLAEASGLNAHSAGLDDLTARLPDLRAARPKVAEVFELVNQPPRPVDEARLAEAGAALDRGESIILDEEYLDRLRTTGEF